MLLNQLIGSFYNTCGKAVDVFFDLVIYVAELLTALSKTITKGLGTILFIGCSTIFIMPIFIFTLHPAVMSFIIIVVLIAIVGNTAVSKLKYYQYIATEYLYDMGTYYKSNKTKDNRRDYRQDYRDMQEENYRRQQEEYYRRAQDQRRQQEEAYNQFFEDLFGNFQGGFYYGPGQGHQGYHQGPGGSNYMGTFETQYKEACDTLGVSYDADEYDIKLAYRKMAKKYHPDLNPDKDTTQDFQKINAAYEFLSEENIRRYKGS